MQRLREKGTAVFLLIIFLFCSKSAAEVCISTRHNSSCEYYVCEPNCAKFGITGDELTYTTVNEAVAAVAAESRASEKNIIWLPFSEQLNLNVTVLGILKLDFRGLVYGTNNYDTPILVPSGNLFNISRSLRFADVRLWTPTFPPSAYCLESQWPDASNFEINSGAIMCQAQLGGAGNIVFKNRTFVGPYVDLLPRDGSLVLDSMRFVRSPSFNLGLMNATLDIIDADIPYNLNVFAISQAKIRVHNTYFGSKLALEAVESITTADQVYLEAIGNYFNQSLQIQGVAWTAYVANNTMLKIPDGYVLSPVSGNHNKALAHWEPSGIYSATCDCSLTLFDNQFINGTLYFDIPYRESTKMFCPSIKNPYNYFNVTHNRFAKLFGLSFGSGGQYRRGRQPPAVAVTGPWSPFIPNTFTHPISLELHRNWWGDSSGPAICCNPQGTGGFSAPFVDSSYWCLDPACEAITTASISSQCVLHGCPQVFPNGYVAVISVFSLLAFLCTSSAIIYAIVIQKLQFTPEKIHFEDSEEIVMRGSRLFLLGLIASSLGSISVLIILALLIHTNAITTYRALQQLIFPTTIIFSIGISILSGLQLIFNLIVAIAVAKRRQHQVALKRALRLFWVWNSLSVCVVAVMFLEWIPTLYHSNQQVTTDANRSIGAYVWVLSSSHNEYLFIGIAGYLMSALSAMIPGRLLHNHACHPEYSRMSNTLEVARICQVVKIPKVERFSFISRIVTVAGMAVGVLNLALQATIFIQPTIYYSGGDILRRAFTPVGLYRVQFGIAGLFTVIGIGAFVGAWWLTKAIRQAGMYTIVTLMMLVALVGTTDVWQKYIQAVLSKNQENVAWAAVNLAVTILWFLALLIDFFLLRSIRRSALKELPKHARDGINSHFDDVWHRPTEQGARASLAKFAEDSDLGEHTPLISHYYTSDDDGLTSQ